jgi:hypothetical protein
MSLRQIEFNDRKVKMCYFGCLDFSMSLHVPMEKLKRAESLISAKVC